MLPMPRYYPIIKVPNCYPIIKDFKEVISVVLIYKIFLQND